jgi:GTP-binding protein LepA
MCTLTIKTNQNGTQKAYYEHKWWIRGMIRDSRGVNCLVQVVAGQLKENDRISIITSSTSSSGTGNGGTNEATIQQQQQQSYSVQEVGIMIPKPIRTKVLLRGQMGYVRFGLRDPRQAMPGTVLIPHAYVSKTKRDSIQLPTVPADSMTSKSVLYASVHPLDSDSFDELCNAVERLALNDVERLALNDTGLEVTKTSSVGDGESQSKGGPFLGPGLRVGFQGLLHVEVFRQRLQDKFQIDAVVTPPKVPYQITFAPNKRNNLREEITKIVEDLSEWVRMFIPGVFYVAQKFDDDLSLFFTTTMTLPRSECRSSRKTV